MKSFFRVSLLVTAFLVLPEFNALPATVLLGKQPAQGSQVLARFGADATSGDRLAALTTGRARVMREYSTVPGLVLLELLPTPRPNALVPDNGKAAMDGKGLMKRIQELQATGAFQYVEPDFVVSVAATPSDAAYANGTLWGLDNTGASGGIAGVDIQASEAWDITTGSANVIVGVIDTGIRYTHQDLTTQMWINQDETPGNGLDDDNDGYVDNVYGINSIIDGGDPMDDNDHGTHVAGTIGARANGGGPHVGVAWNVRLMGLKFLDANGSGNSSDAIECIDFAVAELARQGSSARLILNNSWGGGGFNDSLLDSIRASRDAGVLFVAAAGNDGTDNDGFPHYPSNYEVDSVVSVAAVDRSDQIAGFSNFGANTVHLGAPGVDIYSANSKGDALYSTFSGTSMATPHVAGVAALVWAAHPNATVTEVRQRLLVGAVPIAALNGQTTTGSRLNALNALTLAADGTLELTVAVAGGLQVVPGTTVAVRVSVSDLAAVNNATVTGTLSTGGNLSFVNDGNGPDQTAGDNVYSANMNVPTGPSSFSLNLTASAPGKTSANSTVNFTVIVPPSNDLFANRQVVTSLPVLVVGSNRNSTSEPGEPDVEFSGGGSSVWWSWTAPQNGVAEVSTAGSNFDTLLGVYTGGSVGALSLVGSNDDVTGAFTSTVLFQAAAGQSYHFLVDGYFGDQGEIQFNLQLNPTLANDNFANRTRVSGINRTFTGYNLGATAEGGEPAHVGIFPDRTVWWEWESTGVGGPVIVSTAGSSFDTLVAIYAGSQLGSLVALGGNDDVAPPYFQSEATFSATPGQRYQIVVGSAWVSDGSVRLTIAQPPDNDDFYEARTLTGEFALDVGYSLGASGQTGEPFYEPSEDNSKSVWWTWTAPKTGKVVITTDGSPFDTTLDIFTGTLVNDLDHLVFNDDRSPRVYTSLVTFGANQGTTYHIRVDGYYSFGFSPVPWSWVDGGTVNLMLTMDGASKLSPPVLRENNRLSLELTGEPERPYVISNTANFNTWTAVSTNTPVSRRLLIERPVVPGEGRFFRAQPASLVSDE